MTEIKKVKINNILDSQIPEFLNAESPLFQEFLKQYFISQEHQTGIKDLAENIQDYKKIQNFNSETLIDSQNPSRLIQSILSFDDTIYVSHTIGYPDQYGLIKIDDEIITYTSKGYTVLNGQTVGVFYGCIRGFSGIDGIAENNDDPKFLNFSVTESAEHSQGAILSNLNYQFFSLFFKKFKAQFLPGFEERTFSPKVSPQTILSRAKDFYKAKGTDQSFKILFGILYGEKIEVLKPQNYILRPSDNNYFKTRNILVEKVSGGDPFLLKGKTLYQNISGFGTASASIYNIEYRPIGKKDLYEISLDSTSFLGNLESTGFTKVIEKIEENSNYITVDSTVGFPNSSFVLAKTSDSKFIKINYTDKTSNQFLNVTGLTTTLYLNDEIYENNFAYSYTDSESLIELRVLNVIDNIDFTQSLGLSKGDKITLNSFGEKLNQDIKFNSWIYNIPTYHNIKTITQVGTNVYKIVLFDNLNLYKNQTISILQIDGIDVEATVISVETGVNNTIKNQFIISTDTALDLSKVQKIRKVVEKTSSVYFPDASNIIGGITNTYIDKDRKFLYLTSSGFPNYQFNSKDTKVTVLTGSASTTILTAQNHNFLTGEKIYYNPINVNSGVSTGVYFVTKVSKNLISLSYSNSDVFSKNYINFNPNISDYIFRYGYENKKPKDQKILKKINLSDSLEYFTKKEEKTTFNRSVGILINGVQIYSPTLYDENIYYGKINSIEVTNPGNGYDVINYPSLNITDLSGTGCVAYPMISGSLNSVKILNPGIGYDRKPKITLVGGNGTGCILEPNLVKSQIRGVFKADLTGVNPSNEIITFLNNHNFDQGEPVVYYTNGNAPIPGLANNSYYYVNVINPSQITLYNNVGLTSAVNITGISSGTQEFRTLNSKNTITKIYVKDPGKNYSNRFVKVDSLSYPLIDYQISGISTSDNYIFAKDHGFKDGDFILYSYTDSPIVGLSTNTQYQVTVIDNNKFKLSDVGIGTTFSSSNFVNKKYVEISSFGIGTHTFLYPPIKIVVESTSGIGSTAVVSPVLSPVVLGSVESVYIQNGGAGYGSSEIINYHRRPLVSIPEVVPALLKPVILNGEINGVQIIYGGSNYDNGTIIDVYGKGKYAELEAVVNNGSIVQVLVKNNGVGYDSSDTNLVARRRGSDLKLLANVFEWKINQIERNKDLISFYNGDDETITHPNEDSNLELGVINLYIPKQIRKNTADNIRFDNLEPVEDLKHSPILGWAYDGNPIYGPYGYTSLTDKTIKQISSSYNKKPLVISNLRPNSYPNGFFVQDYEFNNNQDLDEYNGRFCITPEYPYGTYAYFATFDSTTNPFIPSYPYVVGPYFKNSPVFENFDPSFSQNKDLSKYNLSRNTSNYYLESVNSGYEPLDKVNPELKQDYIVDLTKKAGITSVLIDIPGNNYSVNDVIKFEPLKNASGANAIVSRIKGKEIVNMSVGVTTFYDVVLYTEGNNIIGITSIPHNLISEDFIHFQNTPSTSSLDLEGKKRIYVYQKRTGLASTLPNTSITGITTFVKVNDVFGFEVDDTIKIGNEIATIFNVIPETSTLIVNREASGGMHTVGIDQVTLLSKKIQILDTNSPQYQLPKNKTIYFDPTNTIGFGTIGNNYSVVGVGTSSIVNRFVPTKSIYLPNHNFYTGQPLIYSYSSGIGISVYGDSSGGYSLPNNQLVYAVNLGNNYLGISTLGFTTSVGIGTTLNSLLFGYNSSVGYAHSFTTVYKLTKTNINNFSGIVTTTQDHGLSDGDKIRLNLLPSRNNYVKFRFDVTNKKITTDLISFDSSSVSTGSSNSTIYLPNNTLNTGDKIIYYSGTSIIGGLQDKTIYYVIKIDSNRISLCNYLYDTTIQNSIVFISSGTGSHSIALINPPLYFTKGNTIFFDTSDLSLLNTRLDFYLDPNFENKFEIDKKEVSKLALTRSSSGITLITQFRNIPQTLYYKFTSTLLTDTALKELSTDYEVFGHNKISFNPSVLSGETEIISIGNTSFKINLPRKPEYSSYSISNGISSIFYDTDSLSAIGPISQISITSKGKSYSTIPSIVSISSTLGNNASLFPISTEIGKVLTFERIKEGFDYLTDPTISAQMSVPAICFVKGISRIKSVGILTGGRNYNTAPRLKVIGNDTIKLSSVIQGGSVIDVKIITNSPSLDEPLKIIPYNNSNGYPIDNIYPIDNNGTIRVELLNDSITYPAINSGYGSTIFVFPFSIGDQVFVEKCRLNPGIESSANFNSSNYGYNYFTVVGVSTVDYTVDYTMAGLQTGSFGTYNNLLTLGSLVNKKDVAQFEMNLINDAKYYSGEVVISGSNFSAVVMENGWSNQTNVLKLSNCQGVLNIGDKLFGKVSKLNGTIKYVSKYNLPTTYGASREKIQQFYDNVGYLNDFQQKLSDNFYYQLFSYSIKGNLPYSTWKESVKSSVHPSGFKEFSDLNVIGITTEGPVNLGIGKSTNMKISISSSEPSMIVNIDNNEYLGTKHNFALVYEDDQLDDGSVERIYFDSSLLKSYILNKTNKVSTIDDISPQFTGVTTTIGGSIVGISSFKLKSNGTALFYKEFVGSASSVVDLTNNKFIIPNHGFQSGQKVVYNIGSGSSIGIATTSFAEGNLDIIMQVGAGIGSAIYENGYNNTVPFSGIVTGISSSVTPGVSAQYFGYGFPIPGITTSGIGTGAKFQVFITYNKTTGNPISTAIQLIDGGSGYSIGQKIAIGGTFLNGSSPQNDLYFTVSRLANTRAGTANFTYTSVASTSTGSGSGAIFNVTRDANKDIKSISVVYGGSGYKLTDQVIIAGSSVGGSTPGDNVYVSPVVLGTNNLPKTSYVRKLDSSNFQLCGLSTALTTPFDLINYGSGNQSLSFLNPNENVLISIDNIMQSPLHRKNITIGLSSSVGLGTTVIYVNSGINSISGTDIIQIDNEYFKINSIGIGSTNVINVSGAFMGSVASAHTVGASVTILTGDFNIVNDTIYFSTPPYGPAIVSSDPQFYTFSSFAGRAFSRAYDSTYPDDLNLIIDDISTSFTGIAATQFTLTSNGNTIVGLYTNRNYATDISNNPIILINNVFQTPDSDYTIDNQGGSNTIKFLSGVPGAGKIVNVAITTGFGYQPLIKAAATVSVSIAGTINSVTLKGAGSGYRTSPNISIASTVGYGATILATIGAGGTITSLSIVNGGIGYTNTTLPNVLIDAPPNYSNLGVGYTAGSAGYGQGAVVSVQVGSASSIIQFSIDSPGVGYKVGDILKVIGITTNPSVGIGFSEFRITVTEVLTDKFSGFYPGQFILFDDFSKFFNGKKTKFTLTKTIAGNTQVLDLKTTFGSDIILENNIFVFLNDILQVPKVSYTYTGTRIIFNEPPKPDSKCAILYYRGSSVDVEEITPPLTIKMGDIVQIEKSIRLPGVSDQFERVVKAIVTSDQLDTYNYDSLGIDVNTLDRRPIKWSKQTQDRIINGSLVSKARPSLTSKVFPATRIIEPVSSSDNVIYVNNAFPLFTSIDLLPRSDTNVLIYSNKDTSNAIGTAVVSSASTISFVAITTGGFGYGVTTSPKVAISTSQIKFKDPIYNWNGLVGISTSANLLSIVYGSPIVAVGSFGYVAISTDGINFNDAPKHSISENINNIAIASTNSYIAVSNSGKIIKSTGYGSTISPWITINKYTAISNFGITTLSPNVSTNALNEIQYSNAFNRWICVGAGGTIFSAVGFSTDSFILSNSEITQGLNSVAFGSNIIVSVGNNGYICISSNGITWNAYQISGNNLNKIIWTGSQFVIVGDNNTILVSSQDRLIANGSDWSQIDPNISGSFSEIKYLSSYMMYILFLSNQNQIYYSFDLQNWSLRSTGQVNVLNDGVFAENLQRFIAVGNAGTSIYANSVYNLATATANALSGVVTSISIINPGFGYDSKNPPIVLIEPEPTVTEKIISIKADGDFGLIVGMDTSLSIGSTTPKIKFLLKSENYDNVNLGIGYSSLNTLKNTSGSLISYSGISTGDYFIIYDSNVQCGHALTGIITSSMQYVGTTTSFIDGVYYVDSVSSPTAGIVTVTCAFMQGNGFSNKISFITNPASISNGFYGKYSWGKIFGYQNRSLGSPKNFVLNTNNGLVGLSTAPEVIRTRGLFESK